MSEVTVKATLDKAGSETKDYKRYVFGKDTGVEGGIYIKKSVPFPSKVIIEFKEGGDFDGRIA